MFDDVPGIAALRRGEPVQQPNWEILDVLFARRRLAEELNALGATDFEGRTKALKALLGEFGEGAWLESPLRVDFGFFITVGEGAYVNMDCTLLDTYPITIGAQVQLGPGCILTTATHPIRFEDRKVRDADGKIVGGMTTGAPIVIEYGAFLGAGVIVCPGVTIGARSVIGAGSVVVKSIPPDVVAAGNPCRVVRPIDN